MDPMEESMYWIEYVARHKGTAVFETSAVHMSWYIYYHLDIIAVLLLALYIVYKMMCLAVRLIATTQKITKNKTS